MCKTELGIDTFSYYYILTPKQKSEILKTLKEMSGFHTEVCDYETNSYSYLSSFFAEKGVKVWVRRKNGNPWGLLIVVHPMLVLGDSNRSALYQTQKKEEYKKIVGQVDKLLKTINVPCSINEMKLYRIDITVNLIFTDEMLVNEYLRILKRSCVLPHYQLDWFRKEEHKAKDYKTANKRSFKQYCKSAAFFAYDKTAQLEMIDAFPSVLVGKRVLRLETQLRRNSMKKWTGTDTMSGNNWNIIKKLWKNSEKIIRWYIKRLQPAGTQYIRYEDAVSAVKTIKGKKNKERMLYLLRKTSDSETLTASLEKLRKKYGLNNGQQRTILKQFEKLKISPITLTNTSAYESLSSIQNLIESG